MHPSYLLLQWASLVTLIAQPYSLLCTKLDKQAVTQPASSCDIPPEVEASHRWGNDACSFLITQTPIGSRLHTEVLTSGAQTLRVPQASLHCMCKVLGGGTTGRLQLEYSTLLLFCPGTSISFPPRSPQTTLPYPISTRLHNSFWPRT